MLKAAVAIHLVSEWAEAGTKLPEVVLARAEALFKEITGLFNAGVSTGIEAAPARRRASKS